MRENYESMSVLSVSKCSDFIFFTNNNYGSAALGTRKKKEKRKTESKAIKAKNTPPGERERERD